MIVRLIARPQFLSLPEELGTPSTDQLGGPDAQKLIETAGRTCYDSFGRGRNSADFASHILESGHGSVLEHAQYSFFISEVSRGLTHELVRHRVGVAISQRSTRFVDESDSAWIQHPILQKYLSEHPNSPLAEAWTNVVAVAKDAYALVVAVLQAHLTTSGVDALTARKQARGAARGLLGNSLATELVWSANVRSLRHVIQMRGSAAADAEIRELAGRLLAIMRVELPVYFGDFSEEPSPDGLDNVIVRRGDA
jgi:thymidylate synthase (FAD)